MALPEKTLRELFEFLRNERADIRKGAAEALAAHSMNNAVLLEYCRKTPETLQALLDLLKITERPLLGHVLSALINIAVDIQVAQALSRAKCISRVIRLYDSLRRTDGAQPLEELCLMLLNNLTASHDSAVADLLQTDDEDLQGYNLTLMKTHFDTQPSDAERSHRQWFLKICLNSTRCGEGQTLLVRDEWFTTIVQIIADLSSPLKEVVFCLQIAHHCSAQKALIPEVVEQKLPAALAHRLPHLSGVPPDVQISTMETIEALMSCEEGMQALEEVNAKKCLTAFADDEKNLKETRRYVRDSLLPFLDDINDVYVVNGTDGD
jgi:hypothetical protein